MPSRREIRQKWLELCLKRDRTSEMLKNATAWKSTYASERRAIPSSRKHDLVLLEHMMRDWTTRRDDIQYRLLPEARGLELFCSNEWLYDWEFRLCHAFLEEARGLELDVKRLMDLLAKECDSKSRSLPLLEQLLREQLELARLDDALRTDVVASDRGSRKPNCDDIFMRLDNGDKLNYCITPQPIPRVDWGLFVAERKLVVLKLRRAELTYIYAMICCL